VRADLVREIVWRGGSGAKARDRSRGSWGWIGRRYGAGCVSAAANRCEFRSGDYEEIMNKASCLSLLSNAVLGWNALAITKIVTQLRAGGETILDEDLGRISPLLYQHVITDGTYRFAGPKPANDVA
jgi:hypothetical protein